MFSLNVDCYDFFRCSFFEHDVTMYGEWTTHFNSWLKFDLMLLYIVSCDDPIQTVSPIPIPIVLLSPRESANLMNYVLLFVKELIMI